MKEKSDKEKKKKGNSGEFGECLYIYVEFTTLTLVFLLHFDTQVKIFCPHIISMKHVSEGFGWVFVSKYMAAASVNDPIIHKVIRELQGGGSSSQHKQTLLDLIDYAGLYPERRGSYVSDVLPLLVQLKFDEDESEEEEKQEGGGGGGGGEGKSLGVRVIEALLGYGMEYDELNDMCKAIVVGAMKEKSFTWAIAKVAVELMATAPNGELTRDICDAVLRVGTGRVYSDNGGVVVRFFHQVPQKSVISQYLCHEAGQAMQEMIREGQDRVLDSIMLLITGLAVNDANAFQYLSETYLPQIVPQIIQTDDDLRQSAMLEAIAECCKQECGAIFFGRNFESLFVWLQEEVRGNLLLLPTATNIFSNIAVTMPEMFKQLDRQYGIINSLLVPFISQIPACNLCLARISVPCLDYMFEAHPLLLKQYLLPPPYSIRSRLQSLAILMQAPQLNSVVNLQDITKQMEIILKDPTRQSDAIPVLYNMSKHIWGIESIISHVSLLTALLDRQRGSWEFKTQRWSVLQRMVNTDASIPATEDRSNHGLGYLRSMIIQETSIGPAGSGLQVVDIAAQSA